MLEKIYINEPTHTDLNMYRCGIEDCKGGHLWGPAVRDHYIIHYILDGQGTFTVGDTTYSLCKNDGFVIFPNTIVHYQADKSNPWSYGWVGFHGLKASGYVKQSGLDLHRPIFKYNQDSFLKDCLLKMIGTKQLSAGKETRLMGLLYEFLSKLIEMNGKDELGESNRKEDYIKRAQEYIAMNYSNRMSIAEVAQYVGLDRSYLYSIFNEQLSVSPQKYLIKYRIDKACELMLTTSLPISGIAHSVGYEDPFLFSKTFKKTKGLSPRDFRKS